MLRDEHADGFPKGSTLQVYLVDYLAILIFYWTKGFETLLRSRKRNVRLGTVFGVSDSAITLLRPGGSGPNGSRNVGFIPERTFSTEKTAYVCPTPGDLHIDYDLLVWRPSS